MMLMERRALYNLLRMNWQRDASIDAEEWQIADYRNMSYEELFERLDSLGISLDADAFYSFAENFDTPEQLTDALIADMQMDTAEEDAAYLLSFELWRRLVPEKPCLSVFCDELDHLIFLFDQNQLNDPEAVEDILANLKMVLDENTDEGMKPLEAFDMITAGCANDVEAFLYDFISEQIDNENDTYATELLEGLECYLKEQKWNDFLRCRLIFESDPEESNALIQQVVKRAIKEQDLAFNFEVLAFFVQEGEEEFFRQLAKKTLELISTEEEFSEFLALCADYFSCMDLEEKEREVQSVLDGRSGLAMTEVVEADDPHIAGVRKLLGR